MSWVVNITRTAERQFKKLPRNMKERIEEMLIVLAVNPWVGDVRKLKGGGEVWRKRIGAYRIVFEIMIEKKEVWILDIVRRTSTTY